MRELYPSAIRRLEQAYARVRATGVLKRARPGSAAGPGARAEIWVSDGMKKVIIRRTRTSSTGRPDSENSYCASIGLETMFDANSTSMSGGQWILSDAGRAPPPGANPGNSDIEASFNELAGQYLFASYQINGWSGWYVMDETRFQIASAEEFLEGGERVLWFRYVSRARRHHEHSGSAKPTGRQGRAGQPFKIVLDVAYGVGDDDPPVPRSVRYSGSAGESEFLFDKVDFGVVTPAREFTPAFYGLPDVTAPPPDPARGRLVYWHFGLAACAAIAAAIARRRQ